MRTADPQMAEHLQRLIDVASPLLGEMRLGRPDMTAATVAAAVLSNSGRVYTGVCLHVSCGIGFCAEHSAIAEMIKGRETQIERIVAVCSDGVLPPCGRCRELMVQVDPRNLDAIVALPMGRVATLRELLPEHWLERTAANDSMSLNRG
ncbi:MAG TPA: cytidine deaminase [Pirellulaceae bacterium]|nr:cytidine deaminase [Pirellulaceae bacterium]